MTFSPVSRLGQGPSYTPRRLVGMQRFGQVFTWLYIEGPFAGPIVFSIIVWSISMAFHSFQI